MTGANAADVTPIANGGGIINVVKNGGHVTANITGAGTINITKNGAAFTVTENMAPARYLTIDTCCN